MTLASDNALGKVALQNASEEDDASPAQRRERFRFVYRIRGLAMAPPVLFLLLWPTGAQDVAPALLVAGLAVFLLGVGIRVWAQMHLHYRLPVHKRLTQTGPYGYVRNPIYIANTLEMLGLCLFAGLPWFLPVMLLWCGAVYTMVVRREEDHLLNKYGEPYAQFMRDIPRWWPKFSRRPQDEPVSVRQYLVPSVIAELHCFLWLAPFVLKMMFF